MVQKLWDFCDVLRDDGLSYGDYLEQLTYLLFLKMADEQHERMSYDADLKGDAYDGLIEKTAQEGARGAGQCFTPRALISAIVDVMLPEPGHRICDPACGTGGFFLGAYQSIVERFPHLTPDQAAHLRSGAFSGWEIADLPARLCAMNLLIHGIESPESDSPINVDDALRDDPGQRFDMLLTNPPSPKSKPSPKSSLPEVAPLGRLCCRRGQMWGLLEI